MVSNDLLNILLSVAAERFMIADWTLRVVVGVARSHYYRTKINIMSIPSSKVSAYSNSCTVFSTAVKFS
jgi:hypothetical protein